MKKVVFTKLLFCFGYFGIIYVIDIVDLCLEGRGDRVVGNHDP